MDPDDINTLLEYLRKSIRIAVRIKKDKCPMQETPGGPLLTRSQYKYIDSVDGKAHMSAVELLGELDKDIVFLTHNIENLTLKIDDRDLEISTLKVELDTLKKKRGAKRGTSKAV